MEITRVLVVSSGNRSRGPAGEALLRCRLGRHGEAFEIWSAGTAAHEGAELHPLTAEALAQRNAGLRRHRARGLVLADLLGADLVLAAERWHRLHVARLCGEAASRTFTLAEFARMSPHLHESPLTEMIAEASVLRSQHPAVQPVDDDIPDLQRGDRLDHERMVRRLADMVAPIAAALLRTTSTVSSSGEHVGPREQDVAAVLPRGLVAPR